MQIFVKTLTGKSIPIQVESDDNIETVKFNIAETEGIPVDQQKLIYGGKILLDDKELSTYKIENKATIHMVLQLRGG